MNHLHEIIEGNYDVSLSDRTETPEIMAYAPMAVSFYVPDTSRDFHDQVELRPERILLPYPVTWAEGVFDGVEVGALFCSAKGIIASGRHPPEIEEIIAKYSFDHERIALCLFARVKTTYRWELVNCFTIDPENFLGSKDGDDGHTERSVSYVTTVFLLYFSLIASREVQQVETVPSRVKQAIRAGKRKPPLHSFWTLTIDPLRKLRSTEHKGGTHASPRQHERRAHKRRLPSGALVNVKKATVGKAELGRIDKDYHITPPPELLH